MSATDPATLSATELLAQYRRRTLSPVEVAQACLARIARWNDRVGAFCLVDEAGALAAARASARKRGAGRAVRMVCLSGHVGRSTPASSNAMSRQDGQ